MQTLTADILLRAYANGIFPMARTKDDPLLYWIDPEERGILPLAGFHVPRSLWRALRRGEFEIRCDSAFPAVIDGCAETRPEREETWINPVIRRLFLELHHRGLAHSVETWAEGRLVGGLYGLALGGAFFGESMFSRATDASKVALVHLVARLNRGGFTLLDTQFVTEHLARFGATEIPRAEYHQRLAQALERQAVFYRDLDVPLALALTQSSTQRS